MVFQLHLAVRALSTWTSVSGHGWSVLNGTYFCAPPSSPWMTFRREPLETTYCFGRVIVRTLSLTSHRASWEFLERKFQEKCCSSWIAGLFLTIVWLLLTALPTLFWLSRSSESTHVGKEHGILWHRRVCESFLCQAPFLHQAIFTLRVPPFLINPILLYTSLQAILNNFRKPF